MTSQEFKLYVLHRFYQDVHKLEANNYSAERYSFDGVDRSMVFDVAKHAMYMDWFVTRYEDIFKAYERFADQASKDVFVDLLRYRLGGHLHVRLDARLALLADEERRFKERFIGEPSPIATGGMFGSLLHYDHEWNGVRYMADTLRNSFVSYLVNRQYFFARDGVVIEPEAGDHVIDGGAFTGDTAIVFSRAVGSRGRVYAFDPVQNHLDICKHNFSRKGFENIVAFPYGLSDATVHAPTVKLDDYSPGWRVVGSVPLHRIDGLVEDGQIERVDFIKLDVEGSELAALRGAVGTLRRFRPKLAISLYHKPNDFFEISEFVNDLGLGYKLYLEHYTIWDEETVLYALAT